MGQVWYLQPDTMVKMTAPHLPTADEILDALDPDQRAVATTLSGPVCVLAGAGTGKTRAITHRIAYGVRTGHYAPTSVLAVTFTARAAGEMRARLAQLGVVGVQARTFHAAALKQLSYFWPRVVGGAPPTIVEHKARLVALAATRVGVEVDRVAVRDLASEIEWAKVTMLAPQDYVTAAQATGRAAPAGSDFRDVARLLDAYEEVKELAGVIDFEDVLLLLGGMLHDRPDVARQVRDQYRRFVVDEYQDVSPLQQFVLDQWLGQRREVCVVGDPSQTIYSFTGATPHHLLNFGARYHDATTIRLVRDYRSSPQIVHVANTLLASATDRDKVPVLELVSQREPGPEVGFEVYEDDVAEAQGVARHVKELVDAGAAASDVAVLVRTNAQLEQYEEALSAVGLSTQVRGGERFFSRKDVRSAVVLLQGAAKAGTGDDAISVIDDCVRSVGWSNDPPQTRGAVRDRWEALDALRRLCHELVSQGNDLAQVVAEIQERARHHHAPTVDSVTLASLHAAKGLEWPIVHLAGMSEGLMPISLAATPTAIAEERRLLYVGMTRAQELLTLSYSQSRSGTSRSVRQVSRFLAPLWPGGAPASRSRTQRAVPRDGFDSFGRAGAQEMDRAVFEALKAWRTQVATRHDMADHAVLSTSVMRALATARPGNRDALVAVRGMGQQRVVMWGEEILEVIQKYGSHTTS